MRDKGETSSCLQNFVIYVKNHFGKNVKFIHSDNGNEFTSQPMRHFTLRKELSIRLVVWILYNKMRKLSESIDIF